jgi:hypothetical protein
MKTESDIKNEIDDYLQPKIDVTKSYEKGSIVYKQPPGPRYNENGELDERTMIGSSEYFDAALDLFE